MSARALALAAGLLGALGVSAKTVVLIGGEAREGAGRHDYPAGVDAIAAMLSRSGHEVRAYRDAWPGDASVFETADVVVMYVEGHDRHPLRATNRRVAFDAAVKRGVGVVALHQASTVPLDDDLGLRDVLGGVRRGMFDRTTEFVTVAPGNATILNADDKVEPFSYRDEFYPTIEFASTGTRTSLLRATVHPQFRDGEWLVEAAPEAIDIAWAHERAGGGRAVTFTGLHYTASFTQPALRRILVDAIQWTAHDDRRVDVPPVAPQAPELPTPAPTITRATFHADAARSGWRDGDEDIARSSLQDFGQVWQSAPLDFFGEHPPRLYATPLFVDNVRIDDGPQRGETFDTVIAASSNGFVYAINATQRGDVAPGRMLWRAALGAPCLLQPAPLDGVATGILSTPVIDVPARRIYVTHCDPVKRWQAYALDLGSGRVLDGWPVTLDEATFNRLNRNAGPSLVPPKRRFDFRVQRGALALSPGGDALHVVFGESETGWLAAVDTKTPRVRSAFAAVAMPHRGSGGIWGAGGPALDAQGNVYVVTASGFDGYQDAAGDWAQSVLKLSLDADGYTLRGTYSPFNHCITAKNDIDLGSGGAALLPGTSLMAVGGKQGNVYLLDRHRLPGPLDRRAACSDDASSDASLHDGRGPLNVFGPYSEQDAALDLARARSVPAAFRDAHGALHLFATGNTKDAPGSARSIAPSLVKLRVVEGDKPHLSIAQRNASIVLGNPGSPVVTSRDGRDALVWVLDENAPRSALLNGDAPPEPVLYAFDADTLDVAWRSAPGELAASGKYNEAGFGGGMVFVGTDRVQAFGAGGRTILTPARSLKEKGSNVATVDGSPHEVYAQRCAMCHDHAQGNIPPRALLATRPRGRIVEALTRGAMQVHAQGMSLEQIDAMTEYLRD